MAFRRSNQGDLIVYSKSRFMIFRLVSIETYCFAKLIYILPIFNDKEDRWEPEKN